MIPMPELKTGRLDGVDIPSAKELLAMREDSCILRARDGALTQVPAQETVLPHDPAVHPQVVQCGLSLSPDGSV